MLRSLPRLSPLPHCKVLPQGLIAFMWYCLVECPSLLTPNTGCLAKLLFVSSQGSLRTPTPS